MTRILVNNTIPPWIVRIVVGTIISGLILGALAWASNQTDQVQSIKEKMATAQAQQSGTDSAIAEIKASQLRMETKLDRILEARNESSRTHYRYYN
jgi:uncharacterized phage infection (PIP) family protein YhgE